MFSHAVGLCQQCTGQLLVWSREEVKAVYSPDAMLHRQTSLPHDPAVPVLPEQVYGRDDVKNSPTH